MFCPVCVYCPIHIQDVPYLYLTSRMCMGRIPIPYTYEQQLAVSCWDNAERLPCTVQFLTYSYIATYVDCMHGPSMHTHEHIQPSMYITQVRDITQLYSYLILIQIIPIHVRVVFPCILVIGYIGAGSSTQLGTQRVIRRHLYGEKLYFHKVILQQKLGEILTFLYRMAIYVICKHNPNDTILDIHLTVSMLHDIYVCMYAKERNSSLHTRSQFIMHDTLPLFHHWCHHS